MESDQKTFLLDHLRQSSEALETALSGTGAIWDRSPGDGRWSISQCAEHLAAVEERIQERLEKISQTEPEPFEIEDQNRKDERVMQVADRQTAVQAPPLLHPTSKYPNPEAMLRDYWEIHSALVRIAEKYPEWMRGRFADHPVLKKLDGHQWILIASCHTSRHTAQIEEIKQQLNA